MTDELRFAMRLWQRDRGFTATAVLVLALGIGVNTMLFTILDAHTIRGLPLDRPHRVLSVSTRDAGNVERGLAWLEFDEMRRAASHTALVAFVSGPAGLSLPEAAPDRVERAYVSADTFSVLRIEPIAGRTLTRADDEPGAPRVALASETVARRLFGSAGAALGGTVLVDGEPALLVGVVRDASGFPGTAALWQPLNAFVGLDRTSRTSRVLSVVGRVADDGGPDAAAAELRSLADRFAREHPESNDGVRVTVVPINERVLGRLGDPAWRAFMAVGALVLLISAANAAHLMIGRGLERSREVAIRVSLGAGRGRIARQLLLETAVVAAAGGLAGLGLAVAGVRAFALGIPAGTLPYWMSYTIDARVVAALVAASGVTAVVAGVAPAWQAARTDPNATLRSVASPFAVSRTSRRLTGLFLIAELALGVVMIANLVLAVRTARIEIGTDAALRDPMVITARLNLPARSYPDAAARNAFYDGLGAGIAAAPHPSEYTLTSVLPARPAPERRLVARGREADAPVTVRLVAVDGTYFETLRIPLVAGRSFAPSEGTAGTRPVLLNDRLARVLFPGRDPVGQRVGFVPPGAEAASEWLEVVGIAPAIRQGGQPEAAPIVYVPFRADPPAAAVLMVRSSAPAAAIVGELRERVRRLDPGLPLFDVATLRDAVEDAQWNGRLSMRLIIALTAIAVGLAAAGLFAVINRRVVARRREIGIRLALGATPRRVRGLVVAEALRYVAIGGVLGVAGAVAWDAVFAPTARAAPLVRGVRLADPTALAAIGAVLGLVSLLACLAPMRRAQAIEPMTILRHE